MEDRIHWFGSALEVSLEYSLGRFAMLLPMALRADTAMKAEVNGERAARGLAEHAHIDWTEVPHVDEAIARSKDFMLELFVIQEQISLTAMVCAEAWLNAFIDSSLGRDLATSTERLTPLDKLTIASVHQPSVRPQGHVVWSRLKTLNSWRNAFVHPKAHQSVRRIQQRSAAGTAGAVLRVQQHVGALFALNDFFWKVTPDQERTIRNGHVSDWRPAFDFVETFIVHDDGGDRPPFLRRSRQIERLALEALKREHQRGPAGAFRSLLDGLPPQQAASVRVYIEEDRGPSALTHEVGEALALLSPTLLEEVFEDVRWGSSTWREP